MDLNQYQDFPKLDSQNMLAQMNGLPEQLETAWKEAEALPLSDFSNVRRVLIAGMGGSAIGASLLKAYAAPLASVPFEVHRDYGLPAWAQGPETLVIASSHSGNTEETLDALETALDRSCSILVISTGGKIAEIAKENNLDLWIFNHQGQPRAAVGYSFCLLLNLFYRLGFLPDPQNELADAVGEMKKQLETLAPEIENHQNPAKLISGQLIGRWVSILDQTCWRPLPGVGKARSVKSPKPGDSLKPSRKRITIHWLA